MLLLGARGFVGSHLAEAARAAGHEVIGCDRNAEQEELRCDMLDPEEVARAVSEARPDLVVNMAGSASVAASWKKRGETFAVNAGGAQNLLEAVSEHAPEAHVLCVSSAEVYGEVTEEELPLSEDHAVRPVSPYGESKAAMEELCSHYAESRGLRTVVVRAFNQLGPRQGPDFVASDFAHQIVSAEGGRGRRVKMRVGNLAAARDFTDVRDSARAFLAVSQRELSGTFNMCSGRAVKVERLVELMSDATELEVEVERDPELARPVDTPVVYGSAARLHEATGWEPEIPLERTIADLLDWWREELA